MLTNDQTIALNVLSEFFDSKERDLLLLGGAGTGKTWLVSHLLQITDLRGERWVACAFTNKATSVLRAKLEAAGVAWCDPKAKVFSPGVVMTGTTSQLLGVGPSDDGEGGGKVGSRNFRKIMEGLFDKFMPDVVIIDEVSMLAAEHLQTLRGLAQTNGCKIVAVGDDAQLPPVNAKPIDFSSFARRVELREIVRQAADSAIIKLGWAIRNGEPWEQIAGPGIRYTEALVEEFLDAVEMPNKPERERAVFIAYTNRRVDAVQEKACRRLYGHGHGTAAPGEVIIAEAPYQRFCTNQDELLVKKVTMRAGALCPPDELDMEEFPVHVMEVERRTMRPPILDSGEKAPVEEVLTAAALFLTKEERNDRAHPYNVVATALRKRALECDQRSKALGTEHARIERQKAWSTFFRWTERLLTFRHPFACTSHKSQGSTYRRAFVDTTELASFGKEALYVAVTRAADEVVMPKPVAVLTW